MNKMAWFLKNDVKIELKKIVFGRKPKITTNQQILVSLYKLSDTH